jgi:hypothetical protein
MAEGKRGRSEPAAAPGGKRRRPQPPTIELKATEIAPAAAAATANPSPEPLILPSEDIAPPASAARPDPSTHAAPAAELHTQPQPDAPRAPDAMQDAGTGASETIASSSAPSQDAVPPAEPLPEASARSSATQIPEPAAAAAADASASMSLGNSARTREEAEQARPWESSPAVEPRRRFVRSALLTAAAAGAGAAALIAILAGLALWSAGLLSGRDDRATLLVSRVSELDAQLRHLAARPVPAPDDRIPALAVRVAAGEQALAQAKELEGRLARAESTLAAPRPAAAPDPALGRRVEDADGAIKALLDDTIALRKRVDEVAAMAQAARDAAMRSSGASSATAAGIADNIDGLAKRIAALEDALKTLQVAASRPPPADVDRAARFAAAVFALRGSVERGDPFATELAAVKPLISDQAALAPLAPFAATGVPSVSALARELSSIAIPLRRAPEQESQGNSVLDRLQAGAGKLVRIRPVDAPPSPDSSDATARAETQAARGDIAAALAELAKLPAAERGPLEPWIRKAEGRAAAMAQVRQLAHAALDGLGKTR